MAGGIGSRFWPLSNTDNPKQFLDLLGIGRTFLQSTYDRFSRIIPTENIYVVTNDIYKDLVMQQLPLLTEDQILLEPLRRKTAPCIAYASYKLLNIDPDANIVVTPADHLILNESEFLMAIESAFSITEKQDILMTLGITPNRPETGYGYIQINHNEAVKGHTSTFKVKTFTEKPNLDIAKVFVDSGEFVWNSGIFIWSLKSILKALSTHLPEIDSLFRDGVGIYNSPQEAEFIAKVYSLCRSVSIDYGIMESASNVYVRCADFGWSDVGTWSSLFNNSPKDMANNVKVGEKILTYRTSGCIIENKTSRPIIVEGLKDYLVIQTDDATMIINKDKEHEIKNYAADVESANIFSV
jgi:mannose-1-phosphate guanylyltransferase